MKRYIAWQGEWGEDQWDDPSETPEDACWDWTERQLEDREVVPRPHKMPDLQVRECEWERYDGNADHYRLEDEVETWEHVPHETDETVGTWRRKA